MDVVVHGPGTVRRRVDIVGDGACHRDVGREHDGIRRREGERFVGHTQTFISIGSFDSRNEAENLNKYVKTKFCRTILGTLKVTQHNAKGTWKNIPLQNFNNKSDIDWSKSISEIDKQLYKKYDLDKKEIEFIEIHVKEMK